jgi:hypothetical protein
MLECFYNVNGEFRCSSKNSNLISKIENFDSNLNNEDNMCDCTEYKQQMKEYENIINMYQTHAQNIPIENFSMPTPSDSKKLKEAKSDLQTYIKFLLRTQSDIKQIKNDKYKHTKYPPTKSDQDNPQSKYNTILEDINKRYGRLLETQVAIELAINTTKKELLLLKAG